MPQIAAILQAAVALLTIVLTHPSTPAQKLQAIEFSKNAVVMAQQYPRGTPSTDHEVTLSFSTAPVTRRITLNCNSTTTLTNLQVVNPTTVDWAAVDFVK